MDGREATRHARPRTCIAPFVALVALGLLLVAGFAGTARSPRAHEARPAGVQRAVAAVGATDHDHLQVVRAAPRAVRTHVPLALGVLVASGAAAAARRWAILRRARDGRHRTSPQTSLWSSRAPPIRPC